MSAQFGAGKAHSRQVNGTPDEAYNQILNILQSQGAEIRAQHPGQMISAVLQWKNIWITSGMKVAYDTEIRIEPAGASMSTVQIVAKVDWSSTIMMAVLGLGLVFLAVMINPFLMTLAFFVVIVAAPLTIWAFMSMGPRELSEKIFAQLPVGIMGQPAPTPQPAPVVNPSPPAPDAVPPQGNGQSGGNASPSDEDNDVMERLEKLAALRDKGAITPEEFEEKKAELLSRI